MNRLNRRTQRRGSLIPLLAVSAISLFAFVALAVDLGMMAVSRTHYQNAADASALAGCRTLNNKTGAINNDLIAAVATSKATVAGGSGVSGNLHHSASFTMSEIQKVETGQYLYDPAAGRFRVSTWYDVTNDQSRTPPSGTGSWTAMRVTLKDDNHTSYFMKVFGVTTMPMSATATAVYRPRDVAFALDMTGSMAYGSQFNYGSRSQNPDTMVPAFAHYGLVNSYLVATTNQANGSGEAIALSNFTITTSSGPPIVRNFYFDPVNISDPSTPAFPVTSNTASLVNAFHRWNPPESGGDATVVPPVGVTYDFSGYSAFDNGTETSPKGPTPAPYNFATMTDVTGIKYVGDRYRRADGSVNTTDTTWDTSSSSTKAASTVVELLGYHLSGSYVRKGKSGSTNITTTDKFRDPVWEKYGYDLDIVKYIAWKTNSNNENPGAESDFSTKLAAGSDNTGLDTDRFKGYSMGPGYWGKTFFIWPPDPRWGQGTGTPDPTSPAATNPNDPAPKDTSGNYICDWRRRFFLTSGGSAFTAQSGSAATGVDELLFRNGSGVPLASSGYSINYSAVLKWIKSGPQVMPPNLRAGRVLYYSSIPDDVDTSSGDAQQQLDKLFWKNYINYVLGSGGYTQSANLFGYGDSVSGYTRSIYTPNLNTWKGPSNIWSSQTPYMAYSDSPSRPRLHFWFGPLSFMDFISNGLANKNGGYVNWNPGTCNEAQCWQLKSGMNSVLSDVQANHPNDLVGLTMFAYNTQAPPTIYQNPRVATGQNYNALKNALFYPKSLLPLINAGDTTTELRPYNSNFSSVPPDEIPNANGGTDPNTGLAMAFNLLSPSNQLPGIYGTVRGRRGASKVVIFETDGVPNCHSSYTLNQQGYNTYYSNFSNGGYDGNGGSGAMNPAIAIATQISKPMSTTTSGNSGLSLPNAPARVYPIAFGDLFDPVASPNATFRTTALQFMANVAAAGNTGDASATTLPSNQIITGTYDQRINRLRDCMERIFQSGVAVALIE